MIIDYNRKIIIFSIKNYLKNWKKVIIILYICHKSLAIKYLYLDLLWKIFICTSFPFHMYTKFRLKL